MEALMISIFLKKANTFRNLEPLDMVAILLEKMYPFWVKDYIFHLFFFRVFRRLKFHGDPYFECGDFPSNKFTNEPRIPVFFMWY
jgi:hypothetical protein